MKKHMRLQDVLQRQFSFNLQNSKSFNMTSFWIQCTRLTLIWKLVEASLMQHNWMRDSTYNLNFPQNSDWINKKYVSSKWPSFQTISSCKNHCCSFSLTYLTGDLSMDALDVGVGVIVLHRHKSGPPHLDTHGPWQFAEDIGQLFSLRCTALSIEDGPVVQRDLGRTWNVLIQQYYPPPTKMLLETAHTQSYIFM